MAKLNRRCAGCFLSIQTMAPAATRPSAVKNQRCQPEASARKEKAAPVLCARTRLKKPVTATPSPSWK